MVTNQGAERYRQRPKSYDPNIFEDLLYFPVFDCQIRKTPTDGSIFWIRNLSKKGSGRLEMTQIWLQNDYNSQHALTYGEFDKF